MRWLLADKICYDNNDYFKFSKIIVMAAWALNFITTVQREHWALAEYFRNKMIYETECKSHEQLLDTKPVLF